MIGSDDHRRASVYSQLASMENAGVPILRSIEKIVAKSGFGRKVLGEMVEPLRSGVPLGEAWGCSSNVSALEHKVVRAGARAGSLPRVFTRLSATFEARANLKRTYAAKLAYPVLLIHGAIVLPSIPLMILKGTDAFLLACIIPLAVLYGTVFGCYYGYKFGKKTSPRTTDTLLLRIPVFGGMERRASLLEGLRALELLYGNGLSMLESLEAAADVTPNVVVADTFRRLTDHLSGGMQLGEAIYEEDHVFPDYVCELVSTGATTGQLEELLIKANERLEDDVQIARSMLIKAIAGAVFAFAALMVAYQVISFWSNLMGNVNKMTGG
jgi:type IV pilus assembly protein PilC